MEAATVGQATHTFISRGREERLTRKAHVIVTSALGQQQELQRPTRVEFGPDGRYNATEGKDVMVDDISTLATDSELADRGLPLRGEERDELQWLRSHRQFNVRFHEEGREPDRPLPTEREFLADVTLHVAALDLPSLERMLEAERETHNRQLLVATVEQALANVRGPYEASLAEEPPQG